MLYCLVCIDKEDSIETRMQNREEHLRYVKETNVVKFAGPFLSEEDTMIGSLIVIDVENKEAAELWSINDPYKKADLFKKIEIFKFKHLI
jgi:uncharacterized protein YciI